LTLNKIRWIAVSLAMLDVDFHLETAHVLELELVHFLSLSISLFVPYGEGLLLAERR